MLLVFKHKRIFLSASLCANRINWIFGPYVLEQIIRRILSIEILFVLCER